MRLSDDGDAGGAGVGAGAGDADSGGASGTVGKTLTNDGGWFRRIVDTVKHGAREAGENLSEFYHAPYRQTMARAARDEDDLFMLLIASEALGVPNPASYYTVELLPVVYERFHQWHQRMGMPHSPIDGISCC